ncbi:MAG TPA: hypothetical protein VMG30_11315 [Acidobacteriota bacterium]|nr:hypothetical protein [Acidobacteriota bacterium]
MIIETRVPAPKPDTKQVFIKFALRPTIDFTVANVAAVITIELGKVSDARIVLGALAPRPLAGLTMPIML